MHIICEHLHDLYTFKLPFRLKGTDKIHTEGSKFHSNIYSILFGLNPLCKAKISRKLDKQLCIYYSIFRTCLFTCRLEIHYNSILPIMSYLKFVKKILKNQLRSIKCQKNHL